MMIGDVVIIKDENLHRSEWRLGRIQETYPDKDGLVRKVRLAVGDRSSDPKSQPRVTYLERPIQKLVLLVAEEGSLPDEKP